MGLAAPTTRTEGGTVGDLFRDGAAWLQRQLKAYCSAQVTYARGTDSVSVKATTGRTLLRLTDQYGTTRVEWTDRDFLIAAEDLVLSGQAVTPERGDVVTETQGGVTYTFEVAAPAGEPPWRWSDHSRKLLRIHCKQVSAA